MEKDSDEEIMVSDLEYICANVIEDGSNPHVSIPTRPFPSWLITKFEFEVDSEDTSSDTSDNDEGGVIITSSTGPDTLKRPSIVSHDRIPIENMGLPREDGELSSDNENHLEHTINKSINNGVNFAPIHQIRDVKLENKTNMVSFGNVVNVLDATIVVKARPSVKIVDVGTAVFFEDRTHIGEIYDLFGKIDSPFYSVFLKKTVLPLVREGLNVYCAKSGDSVVFVEFDKINRIDEAFESGSESESHEKLTSSNVKHTSIKNKKNIKHTRNNRPQSYYYNEGNHSTYLNAWPPSMKTLKNSYDMRTFYKYGQWPVRPTPTNNGPGNNSEHSFLRK